MRRGLAILFVCCLAAVTVGCVGVLPGAEGPSTYNGTVVSVADGDTIDVRLADGSVETVRLLGVDTPEVHVPVQPADYPEVPNTTAGRACLRAVGENASDYVTAAVAGTPVRLELDPVADRRGGYGRLLAYVSYDGRNLNAELVARGYARVYDTAFTEREAFREAAAEARAAGRGVWGCRV